ncbi:HepT-like ribonuclease domain-containing protein [Endozoicomonas ascidiicola]|uniref:HepT-like ribonuclease domain-containing protein n=1 Tax=Endozoicomonas ascidiicola TaxID=1698521 RepID=UPI001C12B565|nr:HepT-like ribonuclease domain-containing protein [Endozoicomonas ascidiicola]
MHDERPDPGFCDPGFCVHDERLDPGFFIRNLEIIGEASHNVDKHFPQFVKDHNDVPFIYAYEMRNSLAHGYFKVDLPIVWQTIQNDLPALASSVQGLIDKLNRQD